jgi:hypothetical protein
MSSTQNDEAQVLETIVPSLEAEGYSVYVHPSKSLIPPFMKNFVPDAIAFGSPKNLAIEVVREGSASAQRLDDLRERLRASRDWELRVYYIRPAAVDRLLETVPGTAIDASLRSVENLVSSDQFQPALLMGWATLEAAGRALLPEKFVRPQTPGRLVEVLAAEGYVTPTEADVLRNLAALRNQLIHGSLSVHIDPQDVNRFIAILGTVVAALPAHAA